MNNKTRKFIIRAYDNVHAALWAALLVFTLWFTVSVAPKLAESRAKFESQRILEISAEHNFYCEKWGMGARTPAYSQCILDLQAFRAKVEQRFADDITF
jgi:hypothetical protein